MVDCRPVERIKPRDAAAFEATARACALVGWEYRLVGGAGSGRGCATCAGWPATGIPRHGLPESAGRAAAGVREPAPLMAGAEAVGDPIAVLPVLFHLLWRRELAADLSVPLHAATRWFVARRLADDGCGAWPVLRPGDRVRFDGDEHRWSALAGTAVRLRSTSTGAEQVVLAGHLMAAPDFAVRRQRASCPRSSRSGCWTACRPRCSSGAASGSGTSWRCETGLPPDAAAGRAAAAGVRPGVHARWPSGSGPRPPSWASSVRTVRARRAAPATHEQGLWGLVDQRADAGAAEATGRADARLVEAIREVDRGGDGRARRAPGRG